jgi:adenylate cyclase
VRKAANRVRITGQLIDATSGTHIWADRFEGGLEDVFELQDRITASVVGAIEPALRVAEMQRAQTKPTTSLDAYDYFLRALAQLHLLTPSGLAEAMTLARKAIAIDPRYASAYGLIGWCVAARLVFGWGPDVDSERSEVIVVAGQAIEFGGDDPTALWMAGAALAAAHDYERALAAVDRSLSLNPNSAQAWNASGWTRNALGEGEAAIDHFQRAMRLSPHDPLAFFFECGIGVAHFTSGHYEEAVMWADRALFGQPKMLISLRCKAAACGLLGRSEEAGEAVRILSTLQPGATLSKLRSMRLFARPDHMAAYLEGLRKAGVPE